jgi:hypothetical protein
VEEQKNNLLNLLSRVNIRIPHDDEEEATATAPRAVEEDCSDGMNNEEAAGILVKHMGKLKTQWQVCTTLLSPLLSSLIWSQSVLQESVYNRLAGFLLEVVLRRAMRPVLEVRSPLLPPH